MPYNPYPAYRPPVKPRGGRREGQNSFGDVFSRNFAYSLSNTLNSMIYQGIQNKFDERKRQETKAQFMQAMQPNYAGMQGPTPSGETLDVAREQEYSNYFDTMSNPMSKMLPPEHLEGQFPSILGGPTSVEEPSAKAEYSDLAAAAKYLAERKGTNEDDEFQSLLSQKLGQTEKPATIWGRNRTQEQKMSERILREEREAADAAETAQAKGAAYDRAGLSEEEQAIMELDAPSDVKTALWKKTHPAGEDPPKELTQYQKESLGYRERAEKRAIAKQESEAAAKVLPDEDMNVIKATFGVKNLSELADKIHSSESLERQGAKVLMEGYLKQVLSMPPEQRRRIISALDKTQLITKEDLDRALGKEEEAPSVRERISGWISGR